MHLKLVPSFVKAVQIPVSIPFHTEFLDEAAVKFAEMLKEEHFTLSQPKIPIISNVTGKYFDYNFGSAELLAHLTKPVLWNESVQFAIGEGMTSYLNMGPGNSTSSLVAHEYSQLKEEI